MKVIAVLPLLAALLVPSGAGAVDLVIAASKESAIPSNSFFSPAHIAAFEAAHPGVKIRLDLIPDAQAKLTFQTELASGTPPDILVYTKASAENELDPARTMTDLSHQDWVGRMIRPDLLRSPDGHIYLFQRMIDESGIGMVYDKAVFRRLDLDIPRTYSQLLSVCEALKKAGITPFFGPFKDTWTFQIWPTVAWGTLGSKVRPDLWPQINAGTLHWTQVPEFRLVLDRGLDLLRKGYFQPNPLNADYNSAQQAFLHGRVAMMFMGQWFLQDMASKAPDREFGLFPLPVWDDPALNLISQGQIGGALVPLKARQRELALAYFSFLAQPERIAVDLADPTTAYRPNFQDVKARPRPDSPLNQLFSDYIAPGLVSTEMNAYMKVDMSESWLYYQDMIAGNKTPEEVLVFWDRKFRLLMRQKGVPGFGVTGR